MLTIYFDQFAISGISAANTSSIWNKIYVDLLKLKRQKKICCCTSNETIFETSQRNNSGIIDNYNIISELLENYFLNDIAILICQQIAEQIKGITSNPFIRSIQNYKSQEFNQELNSWIKNEFDSQEISICPIETTYEQIISLTKIFFENERIIFIKSINSFFMTKQLRTFYSDICTCLVKDFNFTRSDFIQLKNKLECNDFSFSPTLKIRNTLQPYICFSQFKRKQQINLKNDIFDIRRISSAIPYCNVVFCDSKWKNCLKSLGIDTEYNIRLFSGKSTDLEEFEKFLHSLYVEI